VERAPQQVTQSFVESKTAQNLRSIERITRHAAAMADDLSWKHRQALHQCRACYYSAEFRIAGQAITNTQCGICHVPLQFPSTDVDTVCAACAKKHDLCRHCGADRELRKNRRKFAFAPPQPKKDWTDVRRTTKSLKPATILLPKREETPQTKGDVVMT
jgi:hypothetical protein